MSDLTLEQVLAAGRFAVYRGRYDTRFLAWDGKRIGVMHEDKVTLNADGSVSEDVVMKDKGWPLPDDIPECGWRHLYTCDCEFCRP